MDNDTSPTVGAIAAALSKAQAEFPAILRSRTVAVRSDKGSYSFAYAPLDVVFDAVRPALLKHELAITQALSGGGGPPLTVRTVLLHSSGEWIGSALSMPMPGRAQEVGSAITYLRRYALTALLGVASEEDDDGNAASGNTVEKRKDKPSAPAKPPVDLDKARAPSPPADDGTISDAQRKRLWAIATSREKAVGTTAKAIVDHVMKDEGVPVDDAGHRIVTKAKYDALCKAVESYTPEPGEGG